VIRHRRSRTQLARVAALEWGADAIRINLLHPNAVFDTGIWTPEVLAQRAAHYGMTVDDVLGSRRVALRLGLAWMRYLRGVCGGSVKRALYAYASGSCAGSMPVREKVAARCAYAGGC